MPPAAAGTSVFHELERPDTLARVGCAFRRPSAQTPKLLSFFSASPPPTPTPSRGCDAAWPPAAAGSLPPAARRAGGAPTLAHLGRDVIVPSPEAWGSARHRETLISRIAATSPPRPGQEARGGGPGRHRGARSSERARLGPLRLCAPLGQGPSNRKISLGLSNVQFGELVSISRDILNLEEQSAFMAPV